MTTEKAELQRILGEANDRKGIWGARNAYINETMRVLEMVNESKYKESTVIGDLRAAHAFGVHILSHSQPRHRMAQSMLKNIDPEAQDTYSAVERLLYGAWRWNNALRYRSNAESYERDLAGWCLLGWYCTYMEPIVLPNGEIELFTDVWDVTEVYPEFGGRRLGLLAVDREYTTTIGEFKRRAIANNWDFSNLKGPDTDAVTILDHWEVRHNSEKPERPDVLESLILVESGKKEGITSDPMGGHFVKPLTRQENLLSIPVLYGPVNGLTLPASYYKDPKQAVMHMGQAMVETAKTTYHALNKFLTLLSLDVENAAMRNWVVTTLSGDVPFNKEDFEKRLNVFGIRPGEAIDLQQQTTSIGSTMPLLDYLGAMKQRNLLADTSFGSIPFPASGVAIDRLNRQSETVLAPAREAMEHVFSEVDHFWLTNWRRLAEEKKVTEPMRVSGRIRGGTNAGYFDEEFEGTSIPDSHHVEVTIELSLPSDQIMRAQTMGILRPGKQNMSLQTILDEFGGVEDPAGEMKRIREEPFLEAMAIVDGIGRLEAEGRAALDRGDEFKARGYAAAAEMLIRQMQQQFGGGQEAGTPSGPEGGINPRAGAQPSGNGVTDLSNPGGRPRVRQ
ncbi:hypothetical protein CMI37_33410 [Candidatus Pacearchaeota archaeon]|nr:hypothetical protein [Candidatus Pacearchaeota archaeon]